MWHDVKYTSLPPVNPQPPQSYVVLKSWSELALSSKNEEVIDKKKVTGCQFCSANVPFVDGTHERKRNKPISTTKKNTLWTTPCYFRRYWLQRGLPSFEYTGTRWHFALQLCFFAEIMPQLLRIVHRPCCEHFHVGTIFFLLSLCRSNHASARRWGASRQS